MLSFLAIALVVIIGIVLWFAAGRRDESEDITPYACNRCDDKDCECYPDDNKKSE